MIRKRLSIYQVPARAVRRGLRGRGLRRPRLPAHPRPHRTGRARADRRHEGGPRRPPKGPRRRGPRSRMRGGAAGASARPSRCDQLCVCHKVCVRRERDALCPCRVPVRGEVNYGFISKRVGGIKYAGTFVTLFSSPFAFLSWLLRALGAVPCRLWGVSGLRSGARGGV